MKFYNRETELAELKRIQKLAFSDYSKMTVVTGRRRIGKTSLIMRAFSTNDRSKTPTAYLFVSRKSEAALCHEFAEAASSALGILFPSEVSSFSVLFRLLMEAAEHKKFNLVIDEFQEFDSINRSVFSDMQNHWDQYRRKTKMNLVISGSVYSLMHKIFQNSGEPLFGRADNIIKLKAFPPITIKQILNDNYPSFNNDDLLALFSFTGGVPKYLEQFVDYGALCVEDMITVMTESNSPFVEEGRNLLITELGKNYGLYFSILQAISTGANSQARIENQVGNASVSGHIKRLIEDYDIITRRRPILAKPATHAVRFEIDDNFLHFWFAYFERHRSLVELGNMNELKRIISDSYTTYSGLMLERYFKMLLAQTHGFSNIGSWWEPKGNENEIDIVGLKTEKNQALAAEVKRKRENFRITQLEKKVAQLKAKTMPNYNFELTCLTLDDM